MEIDPPLDPGFFAAPAESVAAVRFAPGHDVAEFPFELYGFHIFVPVTVNGKGPSAFILDSGADASAIVRERAQALGLGDQGSLEGGGVGGTTDMGLIPDVTLGLPGVEVPTHVVAVFPAADHSEAFGTRVEGVLGYDVISRFVVRIDYVTRTLTLYDPATFQYHGSGASLPITFTRNCITVPGTIAIVGRPPIETQIMVDIGSGGTLDLNSPYVAANDLVHVLGKTIPGASHGVGGRSSERIGRLESVRFGPYTLTSPWVSLAQDTRGAAALSDYVARAGARLFSRFTVYLDYPGRRMILEPNARLHEAFEYDMSGLELAARGADLDRIVVTGVFPDSPASRAGIRPEDILSRIDGESAAELRLAKILELFSAGERTVRLIVERDGHPVKVALRLRRRI